MDFRKTKNTLDQSIGRNPILGHFWVLVYPYIPIYSELDTYSTHIYKFEVY